MQRWQQVSQFVGDVGNNLIIRWENVIRVNGFAKGM
jgi:hypothetical protein